MKNMFRVSGAILASFLLVISCQSNSRMANRKVVESFVSNNTNYIVSPLSDTSIVREGYYGFNDYVIPQEVYLKESSASINSLMCIPCSSMVLLKEWRKEGYFIGLSDGHAICFHDTTSLSFMLIDEGLVRNTIEFKIDSAFTRSLSEHDLINFKSISDYEKSGSVHGNVKSVKERGYHIVQRFGEPVKEVDYTSDYTYDENGRLLSYYHRVGDPNDRDSYCAQEDRVYNYKADGTYILREIHRQKFPRGPLETESSTVSEFDASGRRLCDYTVGGAVKTKYEYVETYDKGSLSIDQLANGRLIRKTIRTISDDGSYYEKEYKATGEEEYSFHYDKNGLLLSKYSTSSHGENYEVVYDVFGQLNVFRTGPHGERNWFSNYPSDGLSTYDRCGNIIENISFYDDVDASKTRNIKTYWEEYEYSFDSYGNWISREKTRRGKDERYRDADSYNRWVKDYIGSYSFRGNNIRGFELYPGSDNHVERDIEYY